jgi:hypothetical protein
VPRFSQVLWIAIEVQIFGSLVGADLGVEAALVSPDAQPQLRNIFNLGNMIFTAPWFGMVWISHPSGSILTLSCFRSKKGEREKGTILSHF